VRFDELSADEKREYKKAVIEDFLAHGMTEREALVNYVFYVNANPYPLLEQRYSMTREEVDELRMSGTAAYRRNGGTEGNRGIHLPKPKERRSCGCRRPVIPQ